MSNDTNIDTLSTGDDRASKDFTRVLWATKAVEDCNYLAESIDSMRWSITYGGDCSLEHPMYRALLTPLLGAVEASTFLVTIQQTDTGELHTFQCYNPPSGIKVQGTGWAAGDANPHVMLTEYYPETDSISLMPIKVYLYQIINIHIP